MAFAHLFVWVAALVSAQAFGDAMEPHPVEFHLDARTPVVKSLKDFGFQYYQSSNNSGVLVVHSAEWELRDVYRHRRVARIPAQMYFYDGVLDKRPPHPEGARYGFSEDDLRHMGTVEPGNYEMALLINGKRASNVTAFQVDPNFDPARAPVLTVGMEEAPPGAKIGSLLVWVVGPNPFDPHFQNDTVAFADIMVDGVVHRPNEMAWTGPVGPYSTGETDVRDFNTAYRLKGVDVSKPHDYAVQVGKYGSAVVKLNLVSHDLSREWDAATATMAALPAPKFLVAGVVHDEEGNLALGCEVRVFREGTPVESELTNAKGEYGFSGIEPGTYSVGASPVGKGTPICTLEHVKVERGRTRVVPLTFERTYHFLGHVTDSQGHALEDILVGATWKEPESGTECETMATTRSDGAYEIWGPFPSVSFVGLLNRNAKPHYDAKPNATTIDFTVTGK